MKTGKTAQAGRSRYPEEWIYGLNPVLEALKSGRQVKTVFLSASRREGSATIEQQIRSFNVELRKVDVQFFDSRFPKGHQGIAAVVAARRYLDVSELLGIPAKEDDPPLFLLLDCLEDPRNFGAILRVADAGGVHGVVIQSHRSVSLTPDAVKASAGAAEHVPVAMEANIKNAIRDFRDNGITIIGADAEGSTEIWDCDLTIPLALVIGSEGSGLRKTVKEDCDYLMRLPMKGRVNSLNASVAAGIIIFEILRQRTRKAHVL